MAKFFKNFFVILGSLLIGLGIGLIIPGAVQIEEGYYWLVIIFALILGGFFLGLGIIAQASKKKEVKEILEREISEEKTEKAPEERIIQE